MEDKFSDKNSRLSKLRNRLNEKFGTVPFVQKFMLIHHLEIMTKAGLSIINCLNVLSAEIENPKLKKVVIEIKNEVETGKQLSEVLAKYPKIFPPIYVSMIAAGEVAGKLEEALGQISNQMQKSQRLNSKIRNAMIYPAVIICAMIGISFFVVFYIMPKILVMFEDMNAELPLATKMLIAITKFSQHYWWLIIILVSAIIFGFFQAMKNYIFKKRVHLILLSFPIFGAIIKKINLARFTLTLSSLLASTIPIVEAVKVSSEVLKNLIYKENLMDAAKALKQGQTLSMILSSNPKIFPTMVTEMIMVGEQTGRVEKMLGELSEYYNNEVEDTMNNFSSVIEPVIILMLGIGVAGIAVAVIMPMYSLAQNV
jgi:type IV pilus assembly protein PilC